MKISLIGYMGSGKTTIGKLLAKNLGLSFIDLDDIIEEKEEASVQEIFTDRGEIYFRKTEKEYLHQVLDQKNIVISTGGGTPAYYDNMEQLNQNTISIFLQVNPMALAERLNKEKSKRPLIAHIQTEDLPEFIAKHLFERNAFYQQAASTVYTQQKSEEVIVEEILELIKSHQNPS